MDLEMLTVFRAPLATSCNPRWTLAMNAPLADLLVTAETIRPVHETSVQWVTMTATIRMLSVECNEIRRVLLEMDLETPTVNHAPQGTICDPQWLLVRCENPAVLLVIAGMIQPTNATHDSALEVLALALVYALHALTLMQG